MKNIDCDNTEAKKNKRIPAQDKSPSEFSIAEEQAGGKTDQVGPFEALKGSSGKDKEKQPWQKTKDQAAQFLQIRNNAFIWICHIKISKNCRYEPGS